MAKTERATSAPVVDSARARTVDSPGWADAVFQDYAGRCSGPTPLVVALGRDAP